MYALSTLGIAITHLILVLFVLVIYAEAFVLCWFCVCQQGLNGQSLTFPYSLKQGKIQDSFQVEKEGGRAEKIPERGCWPFCYETRARTWHKAKP